MSKARTPTQTPSPTPTRLPFSSPHEPVAPVKTGMRPGVIAWGAVIVLIGAWALLASFGSGISGELALIVLFGGAGLTLIVSAAVAAVGRPKR